MIETDESPTSDITPDLGAPSTTDQSVAISHSRCSCLYARSRAIGATIVHGAEEDRFDLDAILELPRPDGWSITRVLDELGKAFEGFPDVQKIRCCTRCIQLQFAFMHLGITPMDLALEPRIERVGAIYHSPGDANDELFNVNPYSFASWFNSNVTEPTLAFKTQIQNMRARMEIKDRLVAGTILADAEVEALPVSTNPLRDAPQVLALKLMKRSLNIRYATRDMKRPLSVYLSKIAAEVAANSYGLCAQLEAFAAELDRRMAYARETADWPEECNPAFWEENFNSRWPVSLQEMRVFQEDIGHLQEEL